jgi:peroxiredoxin Q/BCP
MADKLAVGERAPDFSLPDQLGQPINLKQLKGTPVVLYFYPKDDTPGCTKEACDFRDSHAAITKAGAVVLGVSLDGADSHRKFIGKYQLPFSLLCDEDAKVSKAYGVYKEKNMYGRKYWGIERTTVVVDGMGAVAALFRKVKVEGHAAEVLQVLKGLKAKR